MPAVNNFNVFTKKGVDIISLNAPENYLIYILQMKLPFVLILAGLGTALRALGEKRDQGFVNAVYFADW